MHLDDERIQWLADGELSASEAAAARDHLLACLECRRALEVAEREREEVLRLLAALDSPAPSIDAGTVAARAREPIVLPSVRAVAAPDVRRLRWAAGIVLVLALGGAAYALPGSPVRAWLAEVESRVAGRGKTALPAAEAPADPFVAGVAVDPGDRLVVVFTSTQPEGDVAVVLTDDREVELRATSGEPRFTTESGRLVIDNDQSSDRYLLRIPRSAPFVEVRAGERLLFRKESDRVTAAVRLAEGRYRLPLTAEP